MRLSVIGGGQMGRALLGGLLASGKIDSGDVRLVEPDEVSRRWWNQAHPGVHTVDLATAVAETDIALLAVKPNVLPAVAEQPSPFWDGKLVVSIAAGVDLRRLSGWIGHGRVVRVMPNTPSLVGAGASAYCCAPDVTDQDQAIIQSILESVGIALPVSESQMDAVTGLSGSGPAYVCMVIEALADGGVKEGLTRALAMQLATQTVLGTAKMIAETEQHPGQLKDAVASPAGTTIAGISVLEQNGIRGAFVAAVSAAAERSRELGQT